MLEFNKFNPATIFLRIAVAGCGEWRDGYTAAAFVCSVDSLPLFYGRLAIKNTEILYLQAIYEGIQRGLPFVSSDDFSVHAFVLSDGFKNSILKHAPKWVAEGGHTSSGQEPYQYQIIKSCYELTQLGRLTIDRATPVRFRMQPLKKEARRLAMDWFDRGFYKYPERYETAELSGC